MKKNGGCFLSLSLGCKDRPSTSLALTPAAPIDFSFCLLYLTPPGASAGRKSPMTRGRFERPPVWTMCNGSYQPSPPGLRLFTPYLPPHEGGGVGKMFPTYLPPPLFRYFQRRHIHTPLKNCTKISTVLMLMWKKT